MNRFFFIVFAALATLFSTSTVDAQTVTGDSADHLGGTGSIVFQSSDRNATITGKPSWILFDHDRDQRATSVGGGGNPMYQITLGFRYEPNWQPDEVTDTRSGDIFTSEGHTIEVTQTGIDNTYVYALYAPGNGEDGTNYRQVSANERLSVDSYHGGYQSETLAVFARVPSSPIHVTTSGGGWGSVDQWFSSTTERESTWVSTSTTSTTTGNAIESFKGRDFASSVMFRFGDNMFYDGVTEERSATLLIGPSLNQGISLSFYQEGIDNTYVYQFDFVQVSSGSMLEVEADPPGHAMKSLFV